MTWQKLPAETRASVVSFLECELADAERRLTCARLTLETAEHVASRRTPPTKKSVRFLSEARGDEEAWRARVEGLRALIALAKEKES